jgi:hypothetical protein
MVSGPKLFKFYRDLQQEEAKTKRLFYYRVNRWRFDPYDLPRALKSDSRGATSILRLRYVLGAFLVYRVTLHYIIPPSH